MPFMSTDEGCWVNKRVPPCARFARLSICSHIERHALRHRTNSEQNGMWRCSPTTSVSPLPQEHRWIASTVKAAINRPNLVEDISFREFRPTSSLGHLASESSSTPTPKVILSASRSRSTRLDSALDEEGGRGLRIVRQDKSGGGQEPPAPEASSSGVVGAGTGHGSDPISECS